jgi:hypothetical protein
MIGPLESFVRRRPRAVGAQTILLSLLALAMALISTGCRKTPAQLLENAVAAQKKAEHARAMKDPEAARNAALDAENAVERLQALAEVESSGKPDLERKLGEARAAARAARVQAETAEEEHQLRDRLGSLKVRAYRKARKVVLTTVLPQLAAAAEQAAQRGTNQLSPSESTLAEQAWKLVSLLSDDSHDEEARPDWAAAAADLRRWTTNPPVEFHAFLGLSLVFLGSRDFALAELESIDLAHVQSPGALQIYHGGRALLYAMQGWNRLAAREVELFCKEAELPSGPVNGKQLVAFFHAFLAYEALQQREFAKLDSELAQSLRAWPDNPIAVFLTGEKLAANGEWEKAAQSLETQAAGSKDEWIAGRLAQRARDLRDGKGTTKALMLDARFLVEMAAHLILREASDSAAFKKVETAVEQAKTFGRELRDKLPSLPD